MLHHGFSHEANSGGTAFLTDIEVVEFVSAFLHGQEHGIQQFAHMQVGFFLAAIAQDFQLSGRLFKLAEKIINGAVAGTTSPPRWEIGKSRPDSNNSLGPR